MLAELAHDHEARHGHGHGHGHSGHHGKPPVQRYASSGRMVEARAAAYAASSAASAAAAIVGSAATTPAATAARATAEEEGAAGAALNEGLRSLPIREPTALQAETVAARTLPVRHKTLPRIPLGGGGPESPLPGSASIGRSLSRYARASGASAGASSAAGTNGPASPSAGAGLRSTGMSELDGSTADTNNFSGLDTTDSLNLCTKPGSDGAEAAPTAASTTGSRSTAASVQGYSTSTSTGVASDRSGISCGSADNTADGKPPAQTRQRAQEVAALTVQEAATTTQRQQQQQQPAVASAAAAAATLATDAATVSGVPPVKTQATAASEPTPGSPFGTAQAVSLVPAAAATAAAAAPSSAAVAAPAAASPAGAARAPKPAAYDITPAGAFVARPVPADGMVFVSNLTPTAMIEGRDGACWATSDYEITRKLHAGYASSVFKATCLVTNTDVVLKAYNLSSLSTFLRHQVLRELDIHARLTHPSVVQLYSTFKEGNLLVLVQEYVRGGSLDRVRRKLGGRMTEFQSMHLVLLPLLRSLVYLHGRGIVHRDIKPENLLFTPEWQLKLCDFGVSICLHEERAVTKTGSKEYMAPEVVVCPLKRGPDDNKENEQMAYTPAVDVWSLGALMYELLVGFTPFPGGPPARTGADPAAQLRFPSSVGEPARAFVRSCLQLHPFDRPTIPQLLKNAWVQAALESQQQHQLQLKEQGAGKVVADK
ncbi:hypothetical protein HXX76_011548 [Chlamydomonas incerta]|uniref:Protein kinase domain-containing protein n=1 Tax=Chlamydomonas incerta TaxID=51695 RepID=A0A835VWH1_CHLIN|nr:hypothetical protein HXX76_011548 [Chlamydomonas incerta]|eukprot:KAG2428428.1 hypothetical protein HXX76_011548 [Chlamydomonas incerta]